MINKRPTRKAPKTTDRLDKQRRQTGRDTAFHCRHCLLWCWSRTKSHKRRHHSKWTLANPQWAKAEKLTSYITNPKCNLTIKVQHGKSTQLCLGCAANHYASNCKVPQCKVEFFLRSWKNSFIHSSITILLAHTQRRSSANLLQHRHPASPVFFHYNKLIGLRPDGLGNKDIFFWF